MTREAFAQQAVALQDTLYRVSYSLLPNRYDQEDAVQESLRIALQKLHTLREDRYFSTWLIRILIHECYRVLRGKKREIPMEEIVRSLPPDGDAGVMEALMRLDQRERLPLVLHYVEGYKIDEIARMLSIPQGTVKTRMARGRQQARDILQDETEGGTDHEAAVERSLRHNA